MAQAAARTVAWPRMTAMSAAGPAAWTSSGASSQSINHPPTTSQGDSHARPTLPVLRRPLRRGARVLQEDARRESRNEDALQREPGALAPGDARRIRKESHALRLQGG